MATAQQKKSFTVSDAATEFDRTTARIRQICIDNSIGALIEGRIRLLTAADMRKIGKIIAETGIEKSS